MGCHCACKALFGCLALLVAFGSAAEGAEKAPPPVWIDIDTIDELQKIGNELGYPLDGAYRLSCDIDASSTQDWHYDSGFIPLGTFAGYFDGQGHTIQNMWIYRSTTSFCSIFSSTTASAVITDLRIDLGQIVGDDYTAGLVGQNYGTISKCRVQMSLSGGSSVGGIAGRNDGTIRECYSGASVYAYGDNAGGVAGENTGAIYDCISTFSVYGTMEQVGGLVGLNHSSGSVTRCVSGADVESGGPLACGLVGGNLGSVAQSYWDKDLSSCTTSAGGDGKTTKELSTIATYTGWDFDNVWGIVEGDYYPYLRAVTDVFYVDSIEDLQLIGSSYPMTGHFVITQDIDASGTASWVGGGFDPIGEYSTGTDENVFRGVLYGQGHVIRNLTINRPTEHAVGLFAETHYSSTIVNLRMEDHSIEGDIWVGAVVGINNGRLLNLAVDGTITGNRISGGLAGSTFSTIRWCSTSGTVTVSEDIAGGLVGNNYFGVYYCSSGADVEGDMEVGGLVGRGLSPIRNCYATGSVTAFTSSGGGLIGRADGSTRQCYATGPVDADSNAGGLVGFNAAGVFDSYATGAVHGVDDVGGLVGDNAVGGAVTNCYSTGRPTGSTDVGGLVGTNNTTVGSVATSFWDTTTSQIGTSAAGTGLSTDSMQMPGTFTGVLWDFANVWGIDEGVTYPYLLSPNPIHVTSPSGGEVWSPRSVHQITWTYAPDSGDQVKIKLFKGGMVYRWLSGGTLNDGVIQWTVPADLPEASDYKIQIYSVRDFSKCDTSDDYFSVAAPPLSISSPAAGTEWTPSSSHEITWSAWAGIGDTVRIKLYKGGVFQRWISGGTDNDGSFMWNLPADLVAGSNYEIQIYSATDSNFIDYGGVFSIVLPDVQIVHPNGGQQFMPGDPVVITWWSEPGLGGTVKLKLFKGGVQHSWIRDDTENDGKFVWTIPAGTPLGDDYQVQICSLTDTTQKDLSDEYFEITNKRLRVMYPNGGQTLYLNGTYTVTWDSDGAVGDRVKLKLFKSGTAVYWITGDTANDGSQMFTMPGDLVPGTDYSVELYSASDTSIVDFSDAVIGVAASPIHVTAPNGGESWKRGTTHDITWTCPGGTSVSVRIKLYKGATFVRWISGGTSNDGIFSWPIPADVAAGVDYKILIAKDGDAAVKDWSDGAFAITE